VYERWASRAEVVQTARFTPRDIPLKPYVVPHREVSASDSTGMADFVNSQSASDHKNERKRFVGIHRTCVITFVRSQPT